MIKAAILMNIVVQFELFIRLRNVEKTNFQINILVFNIQHFHYINRNLVQLQNLHFKISPPFVCFF